VKTIEIRIAGRVQGVGFRACIKKIATNLGVGGEAMNLPDGRVLITATSSYHLESYEAHTYISFCNPINGSKINCPNHHNSYAIYKYPDGRCLNIGKTYQMSGGKEPVLSFSGGDKCDLGRTSSAQISFDCDKSSGAGELTYFRFNEFCILSGFANTAAVC